MHINTWSSVWLMPISSQDDLHLSLVEIWCSIIGTTSPLILKLICLLNIKRGAYSQLIDFFQRMTPQSQNNVKVWLMPLSSQDALHLSVVEIWCSIFATTSPLILKLICLLNIKRGAYSQLIEFFQRMTPQSQNNVRVWNYVTIHNRLIKMIF